MSKHLVIPDAHAHPDYHNKRFTWLGELIADARPDHVISMGDWVDMPSLCTYDQGTTGYEGRRYCKDIEAGIDAQEKMFAPIRARKKKLPKFWKLHGNHEHRITRAANCDPRLTGVLSVRDLQYEEFGWEVVPYRGNTPGTLELDGISYSHYFPSGVMGRPIGGINPAYQLITKYGHSCTQGHVHTFAYYHRSNAMGSVQGLVCGVFQDYEADWAGVANDMWWRGLCIKHDVHQGNYDLQQVSMNNLEAAYG